MIVRLTPEAEADLGEIFAWYSERGTDLGLDFVSAFTGRGTFVTGRGTFVPMFR